MSSQALPDWFVAGDVAATIRKAQSTGESADRIVTVLGDTILESLPTTRIEAIVEATPDQETKREDISLPLSQSPSIDEEPRKSPPRRVAVSDVEYLSDREFARVLGLALEQFDGNTVRPPANAELDIDLYWNREHTTIGIRTISASRDALGAEHVEAVLDGAVDSDITRSPSELAVVSNGVYEDLATATAINNDIYLFDGGHVEAWFQRAVLPPAAIGTVLEDGENHDGPLTDLVDIAQMPAPQQAIDPLEIERAFDVDVLEQATGSDSTETIEHSGESGEDATGVTNRPGDPLRDDQPSSGETGILYADPGEDGDYDAVNDFLDGITQSDSEPAENATEVETRETQEGSDDTTAETDETAEDVERLDLLLDLLEIKGDVGEPVSPADVETHGSYSTEAYISEFGSLAAALANADVEQAGEKS